MPWNAEDEEEETIESHKKIFPDIKIAYNNIIF